MRRLNTSVHHLPGGTPCCLRAPVALIRRVGAKVIDEGFHCEVYAADSTGRPRLEGVSRQVHSVTGFCKRLSRIVPKTIRTLCMAGQVRGGSMGAGSGNEWIVMSREGLVQVLASNLLPHGYRWYVTGLIPEGKDPARIDRKLIDKYDLDISKWERARRRRIGWAGLRYLRLERFFILIATNGSHPFKREEEGAIRDAREVPIKFGGYALSIRKDTSPGGQGRWRARVSIERRTYLGLKAHFFELARDRSEKRLREAFRSIPFEPYKPVWRQLATILRAVNRARKAAGYSLLPYDTLRVRRRIVPVFGEGEEGASETDIRGRPMDRFASR